MDGGHGREGGGGGGGTDTNRLVWVHHLLSFIRLEAPECFFFETAGESLFVVSIKKAWQRFTMHNNA